MNHKFLPGDWITTPKYENKPMYVTSVGDEIMYAVGPDGCERHDVACKNAVLIHPSYSHSLGYNIRKGCENKKPHTATYGVRYLHESGRTFDRLQIGDVCHARLTGDDKAVEVIEVVHVFDDKDKIGSKEWNRYIKYMLNDSPFKDMYLTKRVCDAARYGVKFDVNKPLNLIMGAAIALRTSTEFLYAMKMWNKLVDIGFTPNEAYFLHTFISTLAIDGKKSKATPYFHGGGHMTVESRMDFDEYAKFCETGKFIGTNNLKPFKEQADEDNYRVSIHICKHSEKNNIKAVMSAMKCNVVKGDGWGKGIVIDVPSFITEFKELYAKATA